jgi:TIR domain-containing protein
LGDLAHDVFISYSSKDKTIGDAVCATLEASGIRCWIAPRDIAPGADWGESIIAAIQGSRVFVLVFSGHANESQQIKREVERAVHNTRLSRCASRRSFPSVRSNTSSAHRTGSTHSRRPSNGTLPILPLSCGKSSTALRSV